ncbi:MAG TPA: alternative ribosome rescue aminoacyl-tRNA hydrolase ArfB [Anaerolineales bacterium]|nr:alternative ribosome rescue aminoacyl-tRNA hydrolase ArfB [Anaerolineales bacterium]
MLQITPSIHIDERDLQIDYIRASGPGGQNVNKVATAAQLRFNINESALPGEAKARLIRLAGKRVTGEGILIIEAKRFRTQEQNREDAIQRFSEFVRKSFETPKARKKTKPTKASKETRLKQKKRKGEIKRLRNKSIYTE